MNQIKKLIVIFPLILVACDRSPDLPYIDQGDYELLESYQKNRIEKILEKNKVAGASVTLFDSNEIIFSQNYGYFNLKTDMVTSDTIFKVSSITKLITAITILKLIDEGKCEINDPITNHIPSLKLQNKTLDKVTIKSLLTHHSGLERDIWDRAWGEKHGDVNDLISTLKSSVLAKKPNTVFSYSNVGYSVLEKLVENVSGTSYKNYVQMNVLKPLGIESIKFDDGQEIYGFRNYKKNKTIPNRDVAAGGLVSDSAGLVKFAQLLLATNNNQLLTDQEKTFLFEPQNTNIPLDFNMKTGFGTMIQENVRSFHTPLIARTGGSILHRSALMLVPEFDLGIVVLINSPSYQSIYRIVTETLANAIMVRTGKRSIPKKVVDQDTEKFKKYDISSYVGNYMSPMGEIAFKPYSNGKLKTKFLNQNFEIYQTEKGYLKIKYLLLGMIPISFPFMDAFNLYLLELDNHQYIITKRYGKHYLVAEKLKKMTYSKNIQPYLGAYLPEKIDGEYLPIESAKLYFENDVLKLNVKSEILKDFTMFVDELNLVLEEITPGTLRVFGNQPGWNGTLNLSKNSTREIYLSGKKFIKINRLKYANK
tara:strand:- start:701 stop:2476 length:1776 start_codon:yes stop_codon:yes gene_type:complete